MKNFWLLSALFLIAGGASAQTISPKIPVPETHWAYPASALLRKRLALPAPTKTPRTRTEMAREVVFLIRQQRMFQLFASANNTEESDLMQQLAREFVDEWEKLSGRESTFRFGLTHLMPRFASDWRWQILDQLKNQPALRDKFSFVPVGPEREVSRLEIALGLGRSRDFIRLELAQKGENWKTKRDQVAALWREFAPELDAIERENLTVVCRFE